MSCQLCAAVTAGGKFELRRESREEEISVSMGAVCLPTLLSPATPLSILTLSFSCCLMPLEGGLQLCPIPAACFGLLQDEELVVDLCGGDTACKGHRTSHHQLEKQGHTDQGTQHCAQSGFMCL